MVPYRQRVQAYLTKSVDSLFRTIQFSNGVVRAMDKIVLSDLKDVSNTAPGDGDVLEWSAAQGKWVPGPGGGGVIPTLQQVMDQGAAYSGTNNFSMASATSNVTDQGFNLALGNASGSLSSASVYAAQSLHHLSTGTSGTAELVLDANGSVDLNWKSGANASGFTIDGTQMLVTDANNTKGLEYAGAYKGFFTTHSLVDKDYVDTQITGIPGLAIGNPITGGGANRILYQNSSQLLTSDDDLLFDGLGFALHTAIDSNKAMSLNGGISSHYTTLYVQQGSSGTANRYAIEAVGIAGHAFDSVGIKSTAQNTSTGDAIAGEFSATAPTGSGNAYGIKVTSSNVGTGIAYGIYQSGTTAINYFAGQLKLGHTAGTAGQFLKSADTAGNAVWADVPAGATSIGELSDAATPATDNVGLGSGALSSITTGDYNVAVGVNAGLGALGASRNVFIGNDAGRNVTGRTDCVAVGEGAMGVGTGGNTNIAVGANALSGVTGQGNVAMGNSAGSSITSGGFSLFLGRNANGVNTQSYQIAIGTSVVTTQASSLALGRSGRILLHGEFATAGRTKLGVNLGNTYVTPTANLHVKGNASDPTTFLVQNGAGSSILQANQNGNIGIGNNTPTEKLDVSGNLKVDGQAYSSTHTLTAGATVTPDFDNGNVQTVTLDQATTLGNPTNLKDGATYIVIVKQPAAANHTLAFGTAYKFEGGTAPTITAANGATDVLTFVSDGTNLYGAAALNFS